MPKNGHNIYCICFVYCICFAFMTAIACKLLLTINVTPERERHYVYPDSIHWALYGRYTEAFNNNPFRFHWVKISVYLTLDGRVYHNACEMRILLGTPSAKTGQGELSITTRSMYILIAINVYGHVDGVCIHHITCRDFQRRYIRHQQKGVYKCFRL